AQNGFDELRRYVKQGSDFSKELAAILQERNYSSSLADELVKPMKTVIDNQMKLRKKKHSHTAARENEKLQDASLDISRMSRSSSVGHIPHAHSVLSAARAERLVPTSERDAAKLQVKKRKTEDAVKKTEVDYYNVCVQAERARLEWETCVVKGAGMLEALEEERLAQLKSSADCYLRLTAALPPQLAETASATVDMRVVRGVRSAPAGASDQLLPDFYCEHTTLAMNRERRKQILQLVKQDIDRERKSKQGLEKLSMAIKQTPTFGSDDSQQNVADKLYHMRSMLTYLEAVRYKITASLNELDSRPPVQHPLSTHIQVVRDKQGLQQSILKVPPWLQADYQTEVNKNLQPNYTALTKSVNGGGEERERRDSIMSRASSKLRIEHLSFRRNTENKSAPVTPISMDNIDIPPQLIKAQSIETETPAPESPLDWGERGAGDGLSNQQDSDSDEFSSQSGSSTDLTDMIKNESSNGTVAVLSMGKCRALYTYEARLNDELTLAPGDIINIHEKQDDGWWTGNLNGCYGIFPSSYVEEITTCI
ncbi:putative dna binding protein, partial [Operophtera brumata]